MADNKKKIEINWERLATPSILSVYLIIALFTVYSSGNFLKKQADRIIRAIGQDNISQPATGLDFTNYQTVATKVGLPQPSQATSTGMLATTPIVASGNDSVSTTTTTNLDNTNNAPTTEESNPTYKDLRIKIYNTTKVAGLAGQLKKGLVASNFENVSSGNLTPVYATTTIQFKEIFTNTPELSEIKNLVSAEYQIIEEILPGENDFDVVILIGNN